MQTIGATARDVEARVQARQIAQAGDLGDSRPHASVGIEFEALTGFGNFLKRHRNMPR
jgi:hypothetical protein